MYCALDPYSGAGVSGRSATKSAPNGRSEEFA
jgi:hypothetical protein